MILETKSVSNSQRHAEFQDKATLQRSDGFGVPAARLGSRKRPSEPIPVAPEPKPIPSPSLAAKVEKDGLNHLKVEL